jgi:protein-S-isoprenylcysteine O-methyltransferase Ste14
VESGIYRYSRNPYFLAYLLMFAAYTVLLQSALLLGLSAIGFILVHSMVLREEKHLAKLHPQAYREYCQRVPRYLIR